MITAEEIIEGKLIAALVEAVDGKCSVQGMLAPAPEGIYKTSDATFINVIVDIGNQLLDKSAPLSPIEYTANVRIRVATPDDKTGILFRDLCRVVFAALANYTGDNCTALNVAPTETNAGFVADSFMLGATATNIDYSGDENAVTKNFTATIIGRITQTLTIME